MSETPTIHALDDATVRHIAAGEVVERPASVVKELIENSLDADASRVTVAVEGGGTDSIRVRDDGVGMTAADLERAVEKHTTSKIDDADDLDRVGTLGFRGEALHTVGAVSRLTIRSRPRDGGRGHELAVEGGETGDVEPSGCPPGTVVEVADLFYNTPARKKFLKREATEFDHVNRVATQYALANPDVATALEHDGREVFATEGSGDLESSVMAVYGREVASSMVAVDGDAGDPLDAVSGLVSHPETTRAGREYLSTFVNGRYVTAGTLREAILDAYGDQLAPDRYPFAVLFVEVPPDAVDVNVHPRKMEVRFDDEAAVADAVTSAVREALLDRGLVRTSAPRGRSAPAETTISPESPEREVAGGEAVDAGPDVNASADADPETDASADDESVRDDRSETEGDATPTPSGTDASARATKGTDAPTRDAAQATGETRTARDRADAPSTPSGDADATPDRTPAQARGTDRAEANAEADGDEPAALDAAGRRRGGVVPSSDQRTLDGEAVTSDHEFDRLPPMRILGQYDDTYLVAETDDGLVLVDQHAADERVNYERLRERFDGDTTTQVLAEPVEVELTAREAAVFDSYEEAVSQLGFHADRVDDRTVRVTTVPTVVAESIGPTLIRDVLGNFVGDERAAEETIDAVADDLLADMACHPSITGNMSLTEGSVFDLLSALDGCENPFACPHGRPALIRIDSGEIDDRFERDYPGH